MTPLQSHFYMPAEWHPHEACWMAWPCHKQTWQTVGFTKARKAYARVAKAIADFEPLRMLVNPAHIEEARQLCHDEKRKFAIEMIPWIADDSWTRDTGPTFLLDNSGCLGGVQWKHNAWGFNYPDFSQDQKMADFILQKTAAKVFRAPLVMEGGSFHTDGEGSLLTTRECLLHKNRNPSLSQAAIEKNLQDYLNIKKIIWLNQGLIDDETNGHIDEIACFIAPGKVLCLISSDPSDPNYRLLQENREILQASSDAQGRRLEVFTVEQPPARYQNNIRLTLSYVNFYMANQAIILPAFSSEKADKAAQELFARLFPDRKIVAVDALDIFCGGGGIHCITQQQPKRFISAIC